MNVRAKGLSRLLLLGLLSSILILSTGSLSQQPSVVRKLIARTAPLYPELARSMALQGTVKVDALVAADGSVKSVEIKGGHPVLAQAALNTVRRWKWEPALHESHEMVEVKFSPE
jgi:TonB family protein